MRSFIPVLLFVGVIVGIVVLREQAPHAHTESREHESFALLSSGRKIPAQSNTVSDLNSALHGKLPRSSPPARSLKPPLNLEVVKTRSPDFDRERAWLEGAIETNPHLWTAYERLGHLLLQQDLPHDAIQVAEKCLHVDENAPYCRDVLIESYAALGDERQMANAIAKCRKFRDGDFFCIKKERDFLLARGEVAAANDALELAFSYATSAEKQEILSRFYQFTGELDKSHLALRRACALGDRKSCKGME